MNYVWQMPDPQSFYSSSWTLDYSRQFSPTIDESKINETLGFGGAAGKQLPIGPVINPLTGQASFLRLANQTGPNDLNGDGTLSTSVAIDINFIGDNNRDGKVNIADASPGQVFGGWDDWWSVTVPPSREFLGVADDGLTLDDYYLLGSAGNGTGQLLFTAPVFVADENSDVALITVQRVGGAAAPPASSIESTPAGPRRRAMILRRSTARSILPRGSISRRLPCRSWRTQF